MAALSPSCERASCGERLGAGAAEPHVHCRAHPVALRSTVNRLAGSSAAGLGAGTHRLRRARRSGEIERARPRSDQAPPRPSEVEPKSSTASTRSAARARPRVRPGGAAHRRSVPKRSLGRGRDIGDLAKTCRRSHGTRRWTVTVDQPPTPAFDQRLSFRAERPQGEQSRNPSRSSVELRLARDVPAPCAWPTPVEMTAVLGLWTLAPAPCPPIATRLAITEPLLYCRAGLTACVGPFWAAFRRGPPHILPRKQGPRS